MNLRKSLLGVAGAAALTAFMGGAAVAETLVLAAPGTPEGFDGDALRPFTQHVVVQTYEGLTKYPKIMQDGRPKLDASRVVGHYAEGWTVSPDGKTVTMRLRQGIKSQDGNELTAEDVVWSWEKSFAQKRTGNFIARVSNVTPNGVSAKSRYEVDFALGAPSAIFLNAITLYVPGIYDSKVMKEHATSEDPWGLKYIETNTAGFGAYKLESLRAGEQAIFVANPNYFGDKPFFDRVVWRAVPSEASRITLLKAGQVQWIDRPGIQQVIEMQKDPKVKVEGAPGRAIASLRMNVTMKPFDDVRVRQALNYGVDKEAIRRGVFLGTGTIAESIVPPIVDAYDTSAFPYAYDPDKAKQLLSQAGAAGFEAELLYGGIFPWMETMAIQVADQLNKLGIKITPKRISDSDLRSRMAPAVQDMPFFAMEDGPIVLDPVYTLSLLAHSTGVSNRAKYKNDELDAIIDQAKETLDRDKRVELMKRAQKIWIDDAPWLMTVYPDSFEAMSPKIVGWTHYPDEHERWSDLRFQ
jgi:ABC-type transport system substrate-binding protein